MREKARSMQYLQQQLLLLLSAAAMTLPPPAAAAGAPPNGYNCSSDRTIYPCQSYAFYRAGANANLLDVASIADLFGVSRLSITRSSSLSPAATNLTYGQPLLIPLQCSCGAATNRSYAAVAYQIVAGDTYYEVSTINFGNLTAYPAVEDVNPSLVPTNLQIGTMTIFPIFCQCAAAAAAAAAAGVPGLSPGLITYVFQPSDTYSTLANRFGTNVTSLIALNGPEAGVKPFSLIVVPVTQIPPPLLRTRNSTLIAAPPPPAPAAAASTIVEKRDRKGAVIGLALALGVVMALAAALAAAMWRRRREYQGRVKGEEWRGKGGEKRYGRSASDDRLMADISEWLDKYRVYGMEELREATGDFDQSRLIDGCVYKGVMDGEVYAIKKMKWNARDELKILQKVNHTNLVKLEGFCIEPDAGTCYLVYEYVENGSLHSWLHPSTTTAARGTLDWRSRLRVALDLANGLQYIHEHTWPRVVHKDIKSSNVLLDAHMHAKIANFGLARSGCNAVTTHIVGTQGYIAPEYLADGLVTTKMDVFAYGVVLLELVSGKEAVNPATGEALWVEAEAEGVLEAPPRSGRLAAWMDPALAEQSFPVESVAGVVGVAKACLHRDPSRRPSMVDVAYTLSKADDQFSDFSEEGLSVESGPLTAR